MEQLFAALYRIPGILFAGVNEREIRLASVYCKLMSTLDSGDYISYRKFAGAHGVDKSTVSRWGNGDRRPSLVRTLEKKITSGLEKQDYPKGVLNQIGDSQDLPSLELILDAPSESSQSVTDFADILQTEFSKRESNFCYLNLLSLIDLSSDSTLLPEDFVELLSNAIESRDQGSNI